MRILLISNFFPPYWVGGYEQIAGWIARGFKDKGHEVHVLTGGGSAFKERRDVSATLDLDLERFRDHYFGATNIAPVSLLERMRMHVFSDRNYTATSRAIRTFKPHVVSFWNPAYVSFSPLLSARTTNVPSVAHFSDTAVNPFRNPHPPDLPRWLRPTARRIVDGVLRRARPKVIVTPSEFLSQKFAKTERLPQTRLEVLHWPIEPTISARAVPQRQAAPVRRFLFCGSVIPEKGIAFLLAAFRTLNRDFPDAVLSVVGDGPLEFGTQMRSEARDLPVIFHGRCDRAAVIHHLETHDAFVFPSVWDEPFAVAPLEAMAMGLCVVGTRCGGTPEAIEDGTSGLLVAPGDPEALAQAMRRLASDGTLALQLGNEAAKRARERHSFPGFMTRLEELYSSVAHPSA